MSVYRQGPRTFTEIYFSMRHETILSGNIYIYIYTRTNIKNEIERGGGGSKGEREWRVWSSVRKGKEDGGSATLDGRMARTNFAPLLPRARYPLHLPEYRERREDIRACTRSSSSPARGHLSHLSSTGNAPRMRTPRIQMISVS